MPLPIFALFLAAFGIGTAEFVIAGLLPDVSVDLGVSIPTAGLLISAPVFWAFTQFLAINLPGLTETGWL